MSEILLVGTTNTITENIRLFLAREHSVTVMESTLNIKEYLQLHSVDLIVADIIVPNVSDLEVIRFIRKNNILNGLILFCEIDAGDNILYAEVTEKKVVVREICFDELPPKLEDFVWRRSAFIQSEFAHCVGF